MTDSSTYFTVADSMTTINSYTATVLLPDACLPTFNQEAVSFEEDQITITNHQSYIYTVEAPFFFKSIITLYDITGKKIKRENFDQNIQWDLSELTNGIYIIEIRNKQGKSVKCKLIK
ncbi:MAG: T9SS type A sorting domain-containing protein [Bacteroidetes bacterium]|nr:T9SS type A sorting domain-containing protein [Bacteroidota bacterium]